MKKVLALVLMLALVMSFSAAAFASPIRIIDDDEIPGPLLPAVVVNDDVKPEDVVLEDVEAIEEEAVEVEAVEGSNISIVALSDAPAEVQAAAKEQIAKLMNDGYTVDFAIAVVDANNAATKTVMRLAAAALPSGSTIFVNGIEIDPSVEGAELVFEIEIPAVVVIAHK